LVQEIKEAALKQEVENPEFEKMDQPVTLVRRRRSKRLAEKYRKEECGL
jgi:hypothetical protein